MIDPDLLAARIPSLASLPPAALRRLSLVAVDKRIRAGTAVFRSGERPPALYFVLAGRVRVVQTDGAGRGRVVHWEESGGALGEIPTFGDAAFPVTAVAHTTVHVAYLSGADARRLATEEPSLAAFFLSRIARRAAGLLDQLERLRGATVMARLARHLLERAQHANDDAFTLGMSQGELAEELGTVREVIVRNLAALKRSGAITQTQPGRYQVRDLAVLRALRG